MLLDREEVNPDKPDFCDQTPLSYAAEGRYEGVAKLLLEREEINPDKPDDEGQSYSSLLLCIAITPWHPCYRPAKR